MLNYQEELLDKVLPFWLKGGLDHDYGGVLTCLDQKGEIYDTDKSVWFQGRCGWLLGEMASNIEPREEWIEGSRSCMQFLRSHCFDSDGRMFFTVTRDGRPLRKRRYAFTEMFAAMAFAAWFSVSHEQAAVDDAMRVFEQGLTRMQSPLESQPKTRRCTRDISHFSSPMILLGTAQSLRKSFVHVLEKDDPKIVRLNTCIESAIDDIQTKFVHDELEAVLEMVLADGTAFLDHSDGRLLNPGHGIEGAWFVMAEGVYRNQQSLIDLGVSMLCWSWKRGWDPEYGGLISFTDVLNKPCTEYWHDMKFWWPHTEAILATLMAWKITGDDMFGRWHVAVNEWASEHFIDDVYGEWYGWLRRDGVPTHRAKGSLWKGPFHVPRMLLNCWRVSEGKMVV